MYNTVVMCAVGVTVSAVIKGSATVTYAFQAVCVLFCVTCTLLLIFVPKVTVTLRLLLVVIIVNEFLELITSFQKRCMISFFFKLHKVNIVYHI